MARDNRRAEFAHKDLLGAVLVGIACAVGARGFAYLIRRAKARAVRSIAVHVPTAAAVDRVVRDHAVAHRREPHARELPADRLLSKDNAIWLLPAVFVIRCVAAINWLTAVSVAQFIPLVGRAVGEIVNPSDPTLYLILGMSAFLGAGYRIPLAAVVFVAQTTDKQA